jgi:hypothetical protein
MYCFAALHILLHCSNYAVMLDSESFCPFDSETHNLKKETIEDQYELVKKRTSNANKLNEGSHVMEYGDKTFKDEKLFLYQGFNPANGNITNELIWPVPKATVNQRDADLLFMWKRVNSSCLQFIHFRPSFL